MMKSSLKGKIIEKYGSIQNFAKKIGKNRAVVDNILSERRDMKVSEMGQWIDALGIKDDTEIIDLFFAQKTTKA